MSVGSCNDASVELQIVLHFCDEIEINVKDLYIFFSMILFHSFV